MRLRNAHVYLLKFVCPFTPKIARHDVYAKYFEFCLVKIKTYKEIVNTFLIRLGRKPRTGVHNNYDCERFIVVDLGAGLWRRTADE